MFGAGFSVNDSMRTAVAVFTLSNYVAPNGISFPTTFAQSFNAEGWATNLATQSAAIPLLTIPMGWVFQASLQANWVAGAPALGTTTVVVGVRDITNGNLAGGASAAMSNSQLAANQPIAVGQPLLGNRNAATGALFNQLSVRVNNSDANAITISCSLSIFAWRLN